MLQPNATLLLTFALRRWLNAAGLGCIENRLHNPRKRRLMGRKPWDVHDQGCFSQFVGVALGRVALVRPHHLRVPSELGVSERTLAIGSRPRYASSVYYTGDAIRHKTAAESPHSRRKGLIHQIPQGVNPRFRGRVCCKELGRPLAWN